MYLQSSANGPTLKMFSDPLHEVVLWLHEFVHTSDAL